MQVDAIQCRSKNLNLFNAIGAVVIELIDMVKLHPIGLIERRNDVCIQAFAITTANNRHDPNTKSKYKLSIRTV